MNYNPDAKFAVFHEDVGTVGFSSQEVANELYLKLEGNKILYKINSDGSMVQVLPDKNIGNDKMPSLLGTESK